MVVINKERIDSMLEKKYNALQKEEKWLHYWNQNKVYKFKESRKERYSIDTPPPTVNGKIHIGHIFSYSQTEMIARYKRLKGYNVFYPFGFDDNGLPSERLVEKEIGKKAHEIEREEFSRLCYETTNYYEEEFKQLFNKLGFSTDWDLTYKTISPSTIKISQESFLDLVKKGYCYRKESPALWCNECLTSIAQAELETKTFKTTFNYLQFKTTEDQAFLVATTRPELLPAIVAVFVHPDDQINKHLIGKTAVAPMINRRIPILSDQKVDIEKGTGIVMCCTFGDQMDIEWWRKYSLPLVNIFTTDGHMLEHVDRYHGLSIHQARVAIIEDLEKEGYLLKKEELEHVVQTHERCNKEVEYTVIKQWFIDTINHKQDFLRIGNEINWYPKSMHQRFNDWVNNILWDWCISRQRYFGVPFPVWYCKECGDIRYAKKEELPLNPLKKTIKEICSCGCQEWVAETDVMDTWATSSLTPFINKRTTDSLSLPMSLRSNASEIIRTWDFYSIVMSYYHIGKRPWDNVMISGFVMADSKEKISKKKGNSKVDPFALIQQYSSDALRYWCASGRLGSDIIYSEETLQRGRKLINKLWNVARFIEMHLEDYQDQDVFEFEFEYMDQWIISKYKAMQERFIQYLDDYEVGLGLHHLEKFFWNFCDNYIEIVKHRLYRPEEFGNKARYSGQKTCYMLLHNLLQCFSIYFPFVSEEVYQSIYPKCLSIHLTEFKLITTNFEEEVQKGDIICDIIKKVRGKKTKRSVSLKAKIAMLSLDVNQEIKEALQLALKDVKATLAIDTLELITINADNDIYKISFLEE